MRVLIIGATDLLGQALVKEGDADQEYLDERRAGLREVTSFAWLARAQYR